MDGECIRQAQIDAVLACIMKKGLRGQEGLVVVC